SFSDLKSLASKSPIVASGEDCREAMAAARTVFSESSSALRSVPWALVVPAQSTSCAGGRLRFCGRVPHQLPVHGLGCLLNGARASMAVVRPGRGLAGLAA